MSNLIDSSLKTTLPGIEPGLKNDLLSEIEWNRKDFDSLTDAWTSRVPRKSSNEFKIQGQIADIVAALVVAGAFGFEMYTGYHYGLPENGMLKMPTLIGVCLLPANAGLVTHASVEKSYDISRNLAVRIQRVFSFLLS